MPQLRIRSGYSFRNAYGRMNEITERLATIECKSAAIVDASTWSHVRWEQAATKAEVTPMFGMEIKIMHPDIHGEESKFKPCAWILAEDTRKFYNATTEACKRGGMSSETFGEIEGAIKFCGAAIDILDQSEYDYIDINPSSLLLARKGVKRHRETGKPIVITGYNDMPRIDDKIYAYAWEVRDSVGMRHIATDDEIWNQLKYVMTRAEFDAGVKNTYAVAEKLSGIKLKKAPLIHLEGDMVALCRAGQASRLARGHIAEWTQEYEDRLVEEIKQIQLKEFDSYFLVVADMVQYAKSKMLVGPARGSSAGSLACYLMEITEVDPIPHDLLFQRFIDISRSDLPDIDIDFDDTKRHLVFEYLQKKYSQACVAKLGNINTLKAASVMAQVGKKFNLPVHETFQVRNALIEYSSGDARYGKGLQDTFDGTGPGMSFKERYPVAAECMGNLEIHPSHTGVHAAGILVCNDPISDYCTVTEEGVAQIDKPDSEYLNLLKIDALGLRTLGIIEDSKVVTAEELYSLKLDDPEVLNILNDDKVSGIFQFEGDAVRSVTRSVTVDKFSKIDNLTALARPGPLASGMAQKYIARASGKEPVKYDVPQLEKYLKDTYGVFLYQEQIMYVVKEIGLFDWVKTSAIRKAMSGRKGEEYFNKMGEDFVVGATSQGVPVEQAKKIWQEMVTFGSWGFNKSHSVSYAIVTYWTCWLKRYHKLAFAAACLRAAKDDEQTIAILRELAKEGIQYTPIDPDYSDMNWLVADGRLIGGIMNAKGYGPAKSLAYVQKRTAGTLTQKDKDRLAAAEVQFADLAEAHTRWGHFYKKPKLIGVTSGDPIVGMKEVKDREECLIIGKLTKKILADENEAIRIKKRGGKVMKGQTEFVDLMLVDDSTDSPMRFRVRPDKYLQMGKPIAETAPVGSWFLVRAWKIQGIDMMIIKNIKRIDNIPEKKIEPVEGTESQAHIPEALAGEAEHQAG